MLQWIQVPLLLWEDEDELAGVWRTLPVWQEVGWWTLDADDVEEVEDDVEFDDDEPAVPAVGGDVADGGSVAMAATPLWGTLIIPEVTFGVKELLPVLMTTTPPLIKLFY